jgi:predicted AAA+ superfamily ATPase
MYPRKLFSELLTHFPKKQVTVITGMRRVGKSTALRYLLNQTPHNNKLYLDFERVENRALFNRPSYNDIERGLVALGLNLSLPAVVALDEIQLVPNSVSVIKSLYDSYQIKFLVTGSSSFYLKNHFAESLAGRKQIFEMWPLDFEEFMQFKGIDSQRIQSERRRKFLFTYYNLWQGYYEEFIQFGGFPEVVLADTAQDKINYLKDILNAYIELDIKLLSDFSVSDSLYKLILLLSSRVGSRVDYSKIASLIGLNRNKIKDYLHLLEYTYFIRTVTPFTGGIDKEISKQPKLYFSDTGILNICGQIGSGAVFENTIANQLARLGKLQYFEKSAGTEIDFILDKQTAFEVKETASPHDLKTISERAKLLKIADYQLIGRHKPATDFEDFVWGGNLF